MAAILSISSEQPRVKDSRRHFPRRGSTGMAGWRRSGGGKGEEREGEGQMRGRGDEGGGDEGKGGGGGEREGR